MMTPTWEIRDFVASMRGRPIPEILSSAVGEATEAERLFYRPGCLPPASRERARDYAERLKALILFLRYCSRPTPKDPGDRALFRGLEEGTSRTGVPRETQG